MTSLKMREKSLLLSADMKRSVDTLAKNIESLLKNTGISPNRFALESKVGGTTMSTLLNLDRDPNYSCTLKKLDQIASGLDVEPWHLLLEDLPDEALVNGKALREYVAKPKKQAKTDMTLLSKCITEINEAINEIGVRLSDDKYDYLVELLYQQSLPTKEVKRDNVIQLIRLAS